MSAVSLALEEDYWKNIEIQEEDIEFIYNHLLELETPLTTEELVEALVSERIRQERSAIEKRRTSGGELYKPKDTYQKDQTLIFPARNWERGKVVEVREGHNPDLGEFQVIQVDFGDGDEREFASGIEDHILNTPPRIADENPALDRNYVLAGHREGISERLEEDLATNPGFVRIASKWFPRALLVDINVGHLNIAEAALDVVGGGPLATSELLEQVELETGVNPKLLEFSLDLALQEDERFDEVGPAGDILWFLKRLEPPEVLETPIYLRYHEINYDRSLLLDQMRQLERQLDDELSELENGYAKTDSAEVRLIFPHLRSGTLPLSRRIRHLFPTAYEAPRIRFQFIDGSSGERFPAWVVREQSYVYGLKEWYDEHDCIPGSVLQLKRSNKPGEVMIKTASQRSSREWIRTVLVGSDGGIVYALLKQLVSGQVDPRMGIAVPDPDALDMVWEMKKSKQPPFEQVVVNTLRELAKLNPQSHVHASELYAAVNVVHRCPPGPIFELLASRPLFIHVGDLHFRLNEEEI
jgi:hypothetical protein